MTSGSKSPVAAALRKAADRAEALAGESNTAEEPLRFAAGLYRVQAEVAAAVQALHAESPLSGRLETDAPRLVEPLRMVHRHAAELAPALLAAVAAGLQRPSLPSAVGRPPQVPTTSSK